MSAPVNLATPMYGLADLVPGDPTLTWPPANLQAPAVRGDGNPRFFVVLHGRMATTYSAIAKFDGPPDPDRRGAVFTQLVDGVRCRIYANEILMDSSRMFDTPALARAWRDAYPHRLRIEENGVELDGHPEERPPVPELDEHGPSDYFYYTEWQPDAMTKIQVQMVLVKRRAADIVIDIAGRTMMTRIERWHPASSSPSINLLRRDQTKTRTQGVYCRCGHPAQIAQILATESTDYGLWYYSCIVPPGRPGHCPFYRVVPSASGGGRERPRRACRDVPMLAWLK